MARTKAFNESEVLDKAMTLFWRKGYFHTSMQDLVDHTGLSRSSIYDTFTDKYGLFLATLSFYREQYELRLPDQENLDLRRFLSSFLEAIVTNKGSKEEIKGCYLVNCTVELAATDPEVRSIVNGNMQVFTSRFASLFELHQDLGKIAKEKDVEALANLLYSSVSSIKMLSKSNVDKKVLQDIADTTLRAILD